MSGALCIYIERSLSPSYGASLVPSAGGWRVAGSIYRTRILTELYSIKEKTYPDLETVILSEVSQIEKEKYHMTSLKGGI